MKRYFDPNGKPRLWFKDLSEIDELMERELRKAQLYPTNDNPVVDLESLVEVHLGASFDQHATLEGDVLGLTEFFRDRRPQIRISSDLTGAAMDNEDTPIGVVGRWRATVAHEASHVILHGGLFYSGGRGIALAQDNDSEISVRLHRCGKNTVLFRRGAAVDWRELQANVGMAGLVMPRTFLQEVVKCACWELRLPSLIIEGSPESSVLSRYVSETMRVSRQAAAIRLRELGHVTGLVELGFRF